MKCKNIFLDDERLPSYLGLDYPLIHLKSYDEFVNWVQLNGVPHIVHFDHDLGAGPTGYDAAKWLINYCIDNNEELPRCHVHSANPVGSSNIRALIESFLRRGRRGKMSNLNTNLQRTILRVLQARHDDTYDQKVRYTERRIFSGYSCLVHCFVGWAQRLMLESGLSETLVEHILMNTTFGGSGAPRIFSPNHISEWLGHSYHHFTDSTLSLKEIIHKAKELEPSVFYELPELAEFFPPQPKYRPYSSFTEASQSLGFEVRFKNGDSSLPRKILAIGMHDALLSNFLFVPYEILFDKYEYVDGSVCGVKL